nr:MAG TPA: hypothetical protein [Caudoviricetes sp.]
MTARGLSIGRTFFGNDIIFAWKSLTICQEKHSCFI